MDIDGNTTKEQIDEWVGKQPEVAFIVMSAIAYSLHLPKGEVNNNNLHDSDHQASFPPNTTLDIGTKVIGLDARCVEALQKMRECL